MFSKISLSYLSKTQVKKLKFLRYNLSNSKLKKEIAKGNLPNPQFALGLYMSFLQASQLKYKKITVLEFNLFYDDECLKDIITYCRILKRVFSINYEIYTFRFLFKKNKLSKFDRSYVFNNIKNENKNFFKKKYSKYFINSNISKEIKKVFNRNLNKAPIAFCSFDLMNFTNTNKALNFLKTKPDYFLPRTILYFDHLFGSSVFEGEMLSIEKFNKNSKAKISTILEFAEQLSIHWNKWIFLGKRIKILSNFENKDYNKKCGDLF